jgi:peptidoglycan/xylan/chitin deacetylase (PgdA/CDA1 family)
MSERVVNGFSLDVDELESVTRECLELPPIESERFIAPNTEYTLDLLDEFGIRATFFVNGRSVEPHAGLIAKIAERGHEIGCHSHSHRFLEAYDDPADFRADLEQCLGLIERETGQRPIGYRAPGNSLFRSREKLLPVLADAGIRYDSSVPAAADKARHGYAQGADLPFRWECGLVELPMPSHRIAGVRFPLIGAHALRLAPYWCTASGIHAWNDRGHPVFLYAHSFELFRQPVSRACLFADFPKNLIYFARRGGQMKRKLKRLFREFSFRPYRELFDEIEGAELPGPPWP